MQTQIADIEIRGLEFIAKPPRLTHHRDVEARLLQLLDILDRQIGDTALVFLLLGNETANVHAVGHAAQIIELIHLHRAAQRTAAPVVIV